MPTPSLQEEFFDWCVKHNDTQTDKIMLETQAKLQEFISLAYERGREEIFSALEGYCEHKNDCIVALMEAGRPTENGGYEEKYKGKWYQSRPVDETPKCDCGVEDIFAARQASSLEGKEEGV